MDVAAARPYGTVSSRALLTLLLLVPGAVWWISVGNLGAYFSHRLPPGQILYLFSKLCGLYAYFFMALQIAIGIQGRGSRYFYYHPLVGILTIATVAGHLSLFTAAASLRSGHIAWDTVIPDFSHGYYKTVVSVGIISSYCLVLVAGVTQLRRGYPRLFRWVHRLAFLVAGMGWFHAFSIGSETRIPIVMTFYICLAAWVFIQLGRQLWRKWR